MILKNIQHIINAQRIEKIRQVDEQREIEASIIQKAQKAKEVRNMADARSLVSAGGIHYLGVLTLWVSMNGSFDFENALRSSIEICFDVCPNLCRGSDLYTLVRGSWQNRDTAFAVTR